MSNTFLTADKVVEEALPILADTMQLPALVWQDPSDTYSYMGDTVQVKKPATFTAVEFDGDLSGEYQDITENVVNVQMNKIASVDVEITSREKSLNLEDFMGQVGNGAVTAIAEKINADIMQLAVDIPYYNGTPGTTPGDDLSDIANTRKGLNNRKVPASPRNLIFNPDVGAKFAVLDALVGLDKSGSTSALREASFGRVHGFNLFENQSVYEHTVGAYTALGDVTVTADAGATTITLESAAGASTATIKKGDRITVDGENYVITSGGTAVDGDVEVSIYPALKAEATAEDVSFVTNSNALNMGFHPYAFTFVSRPLAPASGGAMSQSLTFNGINLRVTFGYDMDTKSEIVSFDTLYGVKTIYPELAQIMIG